MLLYSGWDAFSLDELTNIFDCQSECRGFESHQPGEPDCSSVVEQLVLLLIRLARPNLFIEKLRSWSLINYSGYQKSRRGPMNRRCARSIGTYGWPDFFVDLHYQYSDSYTCIITGVL